MQAQPHNTFSPQTDFLVIGGGIAGLSFALKAAASGTVTVIAKRGPHDSATSWAQGGLSTVVSPADSFEAHIHDTLIAGSGLSRPSVVDFVVREAPARLEDLLSWGARFDRESGSGNFDLHQEGGHGARRILHAADSTGFEIQRALLSAASRHQNIHLLNDYCAIDLITTHKLGLERNRPNRVLGCYVITPEGSVGSVVAEAVLIATGGAGKVYLYTSNPDVATGDGIAMCYRAGVSVTNMEFFQFHPTCLYHPGHENLSLRHFLISEALRGEGATLYRKDGFRFMESYDARAELAPRDIVARAIDHELKGTGDDYVYLDISHRPSEFIRSHFPTIYERCLSVGIDITSQPIPVVPAAHYCCGGVSCGEFGETSIDGLYVAGEVAHTGLHGANRLASNSLLEGLVFGHRAAMHAQNRKVERPTPPGPSLPMWDFGTARDPNEEILIAHTWDEIRRFMWNYVGIVRSDRRLERALHRSEVVERDIADYYWDFLPTRDLIELRNLSLVARLIVLSAMKRRESRGLHFSLDTPKKTTGAPSDTIIDPLD